MKRFVVFVFYLINFVYTNPIVSKTCNLNNDTLDLIMLEGKWYDLARTTNIYNENTWKSGFVSIKFDEDKNKMEIVYSGLNSSNLCVSSSKLDANYTPGVNIAKFKMNETNGSIKIMSYQDQYVLVSLCYDEGEVCPQDKLDIFVWSKNKTMSRDDLNDFLTKNCVYNQNILFNDPNEVGCSDENILTADLDVSLKLVEEPQIAFKRLVVTHPVEETTKRVHVENNEVFETELNNVERENFSPLDQEESSGDTEDGFGAIDDIDIELKFKKASVDLKNFEETDEPTVTSTESTTTETTEEPDHVTVDEPELETSTVSMNEIENIERTEEQDNIEIEELFKIIKNQDESEEKDGWEKLDDEEEHDKKLSKKEEPEKGDESNENQLETHLEESTSTEIPTTTTTTTTTSFPCVEINCPISNCNYGRKQDENGCDTCDCLLNPDPSVYECTVPYCHPCFYGSYTDENGCDSCACKPRPKPKSIYECPKLDCPSCNYGSIKDEYGCETCICIRPNSPDRSYQCPPEPTCPYGTCKYGSILNDYGCATCDCLKSSEPNRDECVRLRCPSPCPHGYFTDSDGCETCICKPEWMAQCYLSKQTCDNECEFGSYLDRNGCPSCECLPNPALKTTCQEFKQVNSNTQCDEDGGFKPKQCNDNECRCVTSDGFPISDFKTNISESEYMNCECALALYEASRYRAVGFKLYCSSNGNYEIIQCVGASCACVNEHGDPLGPSVPIYQKHLLRCEGVYQRVYYEKYLTTIAPTTLVPPLCVFHREKALEMGGIDRHLSIPECDERGEYSHVQCDRQNKYCWCVNTHNGIELYGTRKIGERPNCSLSG